MEVDSTEDTKEESTGGVEPDGFEPEEPSSLEVDASLTVDIRVEPEGFEPKGPSPVDVDLSMTIDIRVEPLLPYITVSVPTNPEPIASEPVPRLMPEVSPTDTDSTAADPIPVDQEERGEPKAPGPTGADPSAPAGTPVVPPPTPRRTDEVACTSSPAVEEELLGAPKVTVTCCVLVEVMTVMEPEMADEGWVVGFSSPAQSGVTTARAAAIAAAGPLVRDVHQPPIGLVALPWASVLRGGEVIDNLPPGGWERGHQTQRGGHVLDRPSALSTDLCSAADRLNDKGAFDLTGWLHGPLCDHMRMID